MRQLLLYTTLGCHLCDQAEDMLPSVLAHANRLRVESCMEPLVLQRVEIADDSALVERYGLRIPVLQVGGAAPDLGWPFDQGTLFSFIAGQH